MAKPFRLTAPIVPEHPRQVAMTQALGIEIAPPGKLSPHHVVWYSISMENYAGEVPGVRVSRGIIAGVLDMFLLYKGKGYFIEIKREDGELSLHQQAVAAALLVAGGKVAVVSGVDELLEVLDGWGIPRRGRIKRAA